LKRHTLLTEVKDEMCCREEEAALLLQGFEQSAEHNAGQTAWLWEGELKHSSNSPPPCL
jgi:hypothetical protein